MNQHMPLFTALADPLRLRILNLLFHAPNLCVCDLELALNEPQAKISRHLAYLRKRDMVRTHRRDQWVHYSLGKTLVDDPITTHLRTRLMSSDQGAMDIERLLEGLDGNEVVSLQSASPAEIDQVIRACCGN